MSKKIIMIILSVFIAAGFTYALDLEISGEIKTGIFWENTEIEDKSSVESAGIHNNDDAGSESGRFRMDMHLKSEHGGMKLRFEQTTWATAAAPSRWTYAFAYGDFLEEQFTVSAGLLGLSPWSAGGPYILHDLELFGIRFETKPSAIPGLNFGFAMSRINTRAGTDETKKTLVNLMRESIIGISYTNDHFHGRFSWRLDGDIDGLNYFNVETGRMEFINEGHEFMYRLEAAFLGLLVPGLSLWVNGWWQGLVDSETPEYMKVYDNWLCVEYAPEAFTALLHINLNLGGDNAAVKDSGGQITWGRERPFQNLFGVRAGFYYNILPVLSVGSAFNYTLGFGSTNEFKPDISYLLVSAEPELKFSFGPGSYLALVYCYSHGYFKDSLITSDLGTGDWGVGTRQWLALRAVISF